MQTINRTGMSPMGDAWTTEQLTHWTQSTDFWTRHHTATEARSGLYRAYDSLGRHLHALMRADSRAEY
jgi:hypothetical protein